MVKLISLLSSGFLPYCITLMTKCLHGVRGRDNGLRFNYSGGQTLSAYFHSISVKPSSGLKFCIYVFSAFSITFVYNFKKALVVVLQGATKTMISDAFLSSCHLKMAFVLDLDIYTYKKWVNLVATKVNEGCIATFWVDTEHIFLDGSLCAPKLELQQPVLLQSCVLLEPDHQLYWIALEGWSFWWG